MMSIDRLKQCLSANQLYRVDNCSSSGRSSTSGRASQLPIEARQLFGWIVAWEKGPARHLAAVTAFEAGKDRK